MLVKRIFILLILCCVFFEARTQSSVKTELAESTMLDDFSRSYYIQDLGFILPEKWNKTLYDTVEAWLGTPYCYAGNSHKGIDCSGFVTTLYDKVYQSSLGARNSGDIYKRITKVDKDELSEGDLVFFHIRKRRITHVGLYLGSGKFVHASASNGVIISDLGEPYYRKYYAGGGHLPGRFESNEVTP